MNWMNAVEDVMQRYGGQSGGTAAAPENPHQDFDKVAQAAPPDVLASGISQAFRSDQTPAFPQMLANLFQNSDPNQRAGLLNRVLGTVGGGNVTPQQASQMSPGQVQQMASQAQQQNPSIVDEASRFYAQHPQVVKAAGGLALTIALQHMLKR